MTIDPHRLGAFQTILNLADASVADSAKLLTDPWHGRVFLNPPYGPLTRQFMTKMVNHHNGIALVAARTETALFHRYVFGVSSAALFVEGREPLDTSQRAVPIVLVAYTDEDAWALRLSDIKGHFVWLDNSKRTGERTLT